MTEQQLKERLYVLRSTQAEMELLENYKELGGSLQHGLEYQGFQSRIIISSISILNEKERFIIENHLINQNTWDETMVLYEKQWGMENGRSIRTLMRMQHRALQKMIEFINRFCL